MASQIEIAQCIDELKTAYPNYQPDVTKTANLWKELFIDVPGDTLKAAIFAILAEPRAFPPSAGEIRGKALELNARAAGIPDAYQAYEEVCTMPADMLTRRVETEEGGANIIYETPLKFSHPLVEITARLTGWPKTFPTENPGVDRGQFIKAYETELNRYMSEVGRHPALTDYINNKRPELAGGMPALIAQTAKRLEQKK